MGIVKGKDSGKRLQTGTEASDVEVKAFTASIALAAEIKGQEQRKGKRTRTSGYLQ